MFDARRLDWIDSLRAVAIILVVLGHCIQGCHYYFLFTSPVKMPLFFAISGYLFKEIYDGSNFFKGLFFRLVIPWFFLALFPTILKIPSRGGAYFLDYFIAMLNGDVIWFMPCFIIAQIIHFLLRKTLKKTISLVVAMALCSVVGLMLVRLNLDNYAMFNNALVVQVFYLIGFLFKKQSLFFAKIKTNHIIVGCLMYILLCLLSELIFPGRHIDVHLNSYYNFLLCFVLIYLGTFLLFVIASRIKRNSSYISKMGQHTLVIYIWHGYAIAVLSVVFKKLGIDGNPYSMALVKTLFACVVCCLVSMLLNRYFPLLIGKKSRK